MERAVDPEFLAIARDIANNPWDESDCAAHEADDWFHSDFLDGGGVVWPNSADIAPETLYEAALAERSNPRRRRCAKNLRHTNRESTAAGEPRPLGGRTDIGGFADAPWKDLLS